MKEKWKGKHIHFIGVGGSGMSGVARIALLHGAVVWGSDIQRNDATRELEALGAHVAYSHSSANLHPRTDIVVTSAAIDPNNVELVAAREQDIRIVKYGEMLGMIAQEERNIAISGTHGKTTTTAMIVSVMKNAGLDPTFLIGGDAEQLGGNSAIGSGGFSVAESCEYDRSFLNLKPEIAVITNIEEEHLDYYGSLERLVGTFGEFASRIPHDGLLVVKTPDNNIESAVKSARCQIETYGTHEGASWTATDYAQRSCCRWGDPAPTRGAELRYPRSTFNVYHRGEHYGLFSLRVPGIHNVINALGAIAVCHSLKIDREIIGETLADFTGVKRRLEIRGFYECPGESDVDGVILVDDYAHHPTEVRASLRAIRGCFPHKRIWCVFQPHQHSRTRLFLSDFARAFGDADKIIVPDIYFVRDDEEEKSSISSMDLVRAMSDQDCDARYVSSLDAIVQQLSDELAAGDILVIMGAGDIHKVVREVMDVLSSKRIIASAAAS